MISILEFDDQLRKKVVLIIKCRCFLLIALLLRILFYPIVARATVNETILNPDLGETMNVPMKTIGLLGGTGWSRLWVLHALKSANACAAWWTSQCQDFIEKY